MEEVLRSPENCIFLKHMQEYENTVFKNVYVAWS